MHWCSCFEHGVLLGLVPPPCSGGPLCAGLGGMGIQAAEIESIKASMPPDIPSSSSGTVSDAAHSKELAAVAVTAATNIQQGALGVELSPPSASATSPSGVDGKAVSAGERWGASWVDQVGMSLRGSAAVRALGARCMLQ